MAPEPKEIPGIHTLLAEMVLGRTLTEAETEGLFIQLLSGELQPEQIAALLTVLQSRTPTADELTGAARVMRAKVEPVPIRTQPRTTVLDTCGTGGAPKTFNVSTAAAIVAAGATPDPSSGLDRVLVAKHGNRSRTGRGSAEVLAQLGVNIDASPEVQARCLDEAGVCFCFAIHHHPAMRYAAPVRRALGFPTIFNLLGPLTNPAGASRQQIGVYRPEFVELLGETLRRLGAERAMVMHSDDGLDELSVTAPARASVIEGGQVRSLRVDPVELGFGPATIESLRATDESHAAQIVRSVLANESGPTTDMVLLSAGAALWVAGACAEISDGVSLARESIDSGRALAALESLAHVSHAG